MIIRSYWSARLTALKSGVQILAKQDSRRFRWAARRGRGLIASTIGAVHGADVMNDGSSGPLIDMLVCGSAKRPRASGDEMFQSMLFFDVN